MNIMNVESNDISITDADGYPMAVATLPDASELVGMSHQEILDEMERLILSAAKRAYQAGYDEHRGRLSNFLTADRREVIKATNRRAGR